MKPPKEGIQKLLEMGYQVDSWTYRKGWWVGYARYTPAICTICIVTGKLLIEVCKRVEYAEVIGNFDA
jgi:hypothetical protein